MNDILLIIDTITKLIMRIAILSAIGTVIYYKKRILEALKEIGRRDPQSL